MIGFPQYFLDLPLLMTTMKSSNPKLIIKVNFSMSIENPISTIRAAIDGVAEKLAANEGLDEPEFNHYQQVLGLFKELRDSCPEVFEKIVINTAKNKALKDEIGNANYNLLANIWEEKNLIEMDSFKSEMKLFEKSQQYQSPKIFKNEAIKVLEKYFTKLKNETKNDIRIISAFNGNEKELEKALILFTEGVIEMFPVSN